VYTISVRQTWRAFDPTECIHNNRLLRYVSSHIIIMCVLCTNRIAVHTSWSMGEKNHDGRVRCTCAVIYFFNGVYYSNILGRRSKLYIRALTCTYHAVIYYYYLCIIRINLKLSNTVFFSFKTFFRFVQIHASYLWINKI